MPIWSQALETRAAFSNQYRLRRLDGQYRWMFDVAAPRVNGDGSLAGFIGSAIDITDQKLAQNALHNTVKCPGVTRFSVELPGTADDVQLTAKDQGAGFDVEKEKRRRGLGLLSMQERVYLVRGRFEIESRPGFGTKVVAVVPVAASSGEFYPETEGASAGAA